MPEDKSLGKFTNASQHLVKQDSLEKKKNGQKTQAMKGMQATVHLQNQVQSKCSSSSAQKRQWDAQTNEKTP